MNFWIMKNIFKIHSSFLIFVLILLFSGYINYVVIFLLIIISHELGHIIMIKILGYKITKIIFYPMGGVITTNININISSNNLFWISISGILMQIILNFIIPDCINNYDLFLKLNKVLIIYNLIPIYPLDGYKIYLSVIEKFMPYSTCVKVFYGVSFVGTFILFYYTKSIITFIYLYYLNIFNMLNYKYYMHKFLLERYLYNFRYRKIKYIRGVRWIYKTRYNYIKCGNIYIEEKDVLSKIFTSFH